MPNKENFFIEKFHLLNSQEINDEINWASSSSNEFEQDTQNSTIRDRNRKRKRKKKCIKNISTLNITIRDMKDCKNSESGNKSPILCSSFRHSPNIKQNVQHQSPVLIFKHIGSTSPILTPKRAQKSNTNLKKQLFDTKKVSNIIPLKSEFDRKNYKNKLKVEEYCSNNVKENFIKQKDNIAKSQMRKNIIVSENSVFFGASTTITKSVDSYSTKSVKENLMKKANSFFDSHFSSEETSQNTISEVQTPSKNSNKSSELEISSCKTELLSDKNIEDKESTSKEISIYEVPPKKIRYKKDGLAYRLNNLVKKRNAQISLWQHEQYLAHSSSFVIPKQENIAFRIQKVNFKYGCYLLEALDVCDKFYYIIINGYNINDDIKNDYIIKLYKPYHFIDFNDQCTIVVNVCKFQIINSNACISSVHRNS